MGLRVWGRHGCDEHVVHEGAQGTWGSTQWGLGLGRPCHGGILLVGFRPRGGLLLVCMHLALFPGVGEGGGIRLFSPAVGMWEGWLLLVRVLGHHG